MLDVLVQFGDQGVADGSAVRIRRGAGRPDGWKAEVTKMRTPLGAPIDDDRADTIVKYLSATYAAQPKS